MQDQCRHTCITVCSVFPRDPHASDCHGSVARLRLSRCICSQDLFLASLCTSGLGLLPCSEALCKAAERRATTWRGKARPRPFCWSPPLLSVQCGAQHSREAQMVLQPELCCQEPLQAEWDHWVLRMGPLGSWVARASCIPAWDSSHLLGATLLLTPFIIHGFCSCVATLKVQARFLHHGYRKVGEELLKTRLWFHLYRLPREPSSDGQIICETSDPRHSRRRGWAEAD